MKPETAPVVTPGLISNSLCGRGKGPLGRALDHFEPIPASWRELDVKKIQRWLEAPMCREASEGEARLYNGRRMVLERLNRRLERGEVTEKMGAALAPFKGWRPGTGWPVSFRCDSCASLWVSAGRVADIAARWPPGTSIKVGELLDKAVKREFLVRELCGAQPPPNARAEIERGFRYLTWTADGAKLFEVAALFRRPEIDAECSGR